MPSLVSLCSCFLVPGVGRSELLYKEVEGHSGKPTAPSRRRLF